MSNRRVLVWLLMLNLVVVAAHVLLTLGGASRAALMPRTNLLTIDDSAVSRISIEAEGAKRMTFARNGDWRFIDPFQGRVDASAIAQLVDALGYSPIIETYTDQELLKVGRVRADFGLDPARIVIRLKEGEKDVSVALGSATPAGDGVYASVEGIGAVFVVGKGILESADRPLDDFRSREIFAIDAPSVQSVDIKRGGDSFLRFRREDGGWKMIEPQETPATDAVVDKLVKEVVASSIIGFVWSVGGTNETAETSSALLSGYGLDPESAVTISLKGADRAERRISLGTDAGEGKVYALVHNGGAVVTIDKELKTLATFESSRFSDTRLFPFGVAQVSGISLVDGEKSVQFAKDEKGVWRMDVPISAPATPNSVERLLLKILKLQNSDLDEKGVSVKLSQQSDPVIVSRERLLGEMRFEDFRSPEIISVDVASVKRLVAAGGLSKPTSVVYDDERNAWNVESAGIPGVVSGSAVEGILSSLSPLKAVRIENLKVSAMELRDYGLESPSASLAIDFRDEDSVRRNILIGNRTDGGYFATVGTTDAVFVLPTETVNRFTTALVE